MSRILNCLICDDEPHALELLQLYIEKTPFLQVQEAVTSPLQALEVLRRGDTDLLFLDIQMDELSGLQLLDIAAPACPVILTTAYPEYALKGYEYAVIDYLLKPFSFERFLKAAGRAQASSPRDKPPSSPTPAEIAPEAIFLKGDAKHKWHRVRLNEILYVEGVKNYVRFVCDGQRITSLQNLKDLEQELPAERFRRVHRSYLVNLDRISEIDGNSLRIGDALIPIGSSYRKGFFALMKDRTFGGGRG